MTSKTTLSKKTKDLASRIKDKGARKASDMAKASDLEYFWMWAELAFEKNESYPIEWEMIFDFVVTHLEGEIPDEVERNMLASGMKKKPGKHKLKTVKRRVSTLSWKHKELGFKDDVNGAKHHEISVILKKAANDIRHKTKSSKAVVKTTLKKLLSSIDASNIGLRNRALISLTWSSGRRRSEANSLCIEDIKTDEPNYYIFELNKRKTSKSSDDTLKFKVSGQTKIYLDEWLKVSGITKGLIFRKVYKNGKIADTGISDTQFYRIIKKLCNEANIEGAENITPHSLRSGFVTELGIQGGNIGEGMASTGHTTLNTFISYYQAGETESNSTTDLLDD